MSGEDHTILCSSDDCPCFLAGERSKALSIEDATTDLREALRRLLDELTEAAS